MTPEKAQELINKWKELRQQIPPNKWYELEYQDVIYEMLPILAELKEAGYDVTDDGVWFHTSEAN